jgi:hypothetical protein
VIRAAPSRRIAGIVSVFPLATPTAIGSHRRVRAPLVFAALIARIGCRARVLPVVALAPTRFVGCGLPKRSGRDAAFSDGPGPRTLTYCENCNISFFSE